LILHVYHEAGEKERKAFLVNLKPRGTSKKILERGGHKKIKAVLVLKGVPNLLFMSL
jgi:hypothetical protein